MSNKKNKPTRNYIDLIKLRAAKLLQKQDVDIILNDDVWDKDILIVKSGGYLTESLVNKLINFGIKEVSVDFSEKKEGDSNASSFKDFVKTQNILIIENDLSYISWLVKNLAVAGFGRNNIFITGDPNSINRFFRNKKFNFIFIASSLYEKCQKCVDKYSLLRNVHAFVMMEENDSARKLKYGYNSDVKFLIKPVNAKKIKFFVNRALNQNFLDFYMDDIEIS